MIIDNLQQLQQLTDKDLLVVPIPADDRLHPTQSEVIALALLDLETKQGYIVSLSHPEATYHIAKTDIALFKGKLYCTNIPLIWNYFDHNTLHGVQLYDYDMMYYLHTNRTYKVLPDFTTHYNHTLAACKKTNALLSMLVLQSRAHILYNQSVPEFFEIPHGYEFYSKTLRGSLNWIQRNGLHVNKEKFKNTFERTFSRYGDRCYTQYNYYTTTGRPSNRFGNVNFAALPKDKTRECFISRFGKEGMLVELDFNSYHPRIIASLIGYDFGKENVYEHLAKHYHNTDKPNQDQIKKAKEDTFRQLYGGINKEYLGIEFFKKTDELARNLWNHMKQHGYIESPISGRRLIGTNHKDLTLYTLFNYFIQMTETEINANIISWMGRHWVQSGVDDSVPVLYTYDSILFDVRKQDYDLIFNKILPASIDTTKFPYKLKSGNNYANLEFC